MRILYHNERFVDEEAVHISPFDRGLLYGDGLFETIKIADGRIHFLDEHLARLLESCRALSIAGAEAHDFRKVIERLVDENNLDGGGCAKILVTRGTHTGDLTLFKPTAPSVIASVLPYRLPEKIAGGDGLRLMICDRPRQNEKGSLWRHKSLNYLLYLQVRDEAVRAGYDDGILLNQNGDICESSTANVFALSGERISTPALDCGILPGIVRAEIIKLLARHGTPVAETRMRPRELRSADEIFLTNSLIEVAPISAIDGNEGLSCNRTQEIKALFEQYRDRAISSP